MGENSPNLVALLVVWLKGATPSTFLRRKQFAVNP
jgi:hypothetical protein